jgi:pimeloyl-ACP methyl ester carboxylesterase
MSYPLSQLNSIVAGSGPPLVLIHGNPATHTLWRPLMAALSKHHTVYAIDLPGYGWSPPPANRQDMSRERLAQIVLDWAGMQGLERFDLVGHSFGGSVAATMADKQPQRIRSLALFTPLGHRPPPAGFLASSFVARMIVRPLWKMAPSCLRRWFARRGARMSYGAAYTKVRGREVAREAGRRFMIDSMTEVMRRVDYRAYHDLLVRLNNRHRMPLLLLGAKRDAIIPYSHFERTRSMLNRAQVHVLSDGGHVPMWQYPGQVAEMLAEFYRNIGSE